MFDKQDLAIQHAERVGSTVVLANDPDAGELFLALRLDELPEACIDVQFFSLVRPCRLFCRPLLRRGASRSRKVECVHG